MAEMETEVSALLEKIKTIPLDPFLLLACLVAPYLYLRSHGFDFSKGTSFTLVDVFLFLLVFKACWLWGGVFKKALVQKTKEGSGFISSLRAFVGEDLWAFWLLAIIFSVWGLFSAPFGRLFIDVSSPIKWSMVISAVAQYAFILAAFPLMAAFFIRTSQQRLWMVRIISLGYLGPMLITFALSAQEKGSSWHDMFFAVNRAIGSYGNANTFAYVLLILFPFYVYLAACDASSFWRRLGFFGTASSLVSLVLCGSFSGWLALSFLVIGFCVCCAFLSSGLSLSKKAALKFLAKVAGLVLVLVMGLSLYSPQSVRNVVWRMGPALGVSAKEGYKWEIYVRDLRMDMGVVLGLSDVGEVTKKKAKNRQRYESYDAEINAQAKRGMQEEEAWEKMGSSTQRVAMMKDSFLMILDRWGGVFIGHGLRQTFAFPQFHFFGHPLNVHNLYLLLWIEGGFVLLALFLVFLGLLARQIVRFYKKDPALALTFGASLFSIVLICGVNTHLYLRFFWLPLLPLFSLYISTDEKE